MRRRISAMRRPIKERANLFSCRNLSRLCLALDELHHRLYVLNRFNNSVSIVDAGRASSHEDEITLREELCRPIRQSLHSRGGEWLTLRLRTDLFHQNLTSLSPIAHTPFTRSS
jgi:hypothetical protein